MTLIGRKTDYALLLLGELARRKDAANARELAHAFGLSKAFVANILKQLCQGGAIESQRGIRGGYRLVRSADALSVREVISMMEGEFQFVDCAGEHREHDCGISEICPVRVPLQRLHERLLAVLGDVTVADLRPDTELVTLNLETARHGAVAHLS
jgi:Rrf2 family protein